VRRIGVELTNHSFQVHGGDDHDPVVVRTQRPRGHMRSVWARLPLCGVGMDVCARAHDGAREVGQRGHPGRRMAPQGVPPYRQPPKHDGDEAEALGTAVSRSSMRVIPIPAVAHQAVLPGPRASALRGGHRTALAPQRRGVLGRGVHAASMGPAVCANAQATAGRPSAAGAGPGGSAGSPPCEASALHGGTPT